MIPTEVKQRPQRENCLRCFFGQAFVYKNTGHFDGIYFRPLQQEKALPISPTQPDLLSPTCS